MQRRARHAQKYFKYDQTHVDGTVAITADVDAEFNYESVRLVDIAPELLHLGQLSMIDKTVRIDLQLTPKEKVLTVSNNGVAADCSIGAASYTITDVCCYSRMLQIKPSMVPALKQASMVPIS